MKAWDFYAVVYSADHRTAIVLCNECLPDDVSINDDTIQPIFADSEWDSYPVCDKCHAEHDYVTLIAQR